MMGLVTTEPPAAPVDVGTTPTDFEFYLQSVTISDTKVPLPRVGVTAIVGGNNVGKSTVLSELRSMFSRHPFTPEIDTRLVTGVELHRSESVESLAAWLASNAARVHTPDERFVRLGGASIAAGEIPFYWNNTTPTLPSLAGLSSMLIHSSVALERAQVVNPVPQRPDIAEPPSHPLHVLQDDEVLLAKVSSISQEILRVPLTLDRLSGNSVLRVGVPTVQAPTLDNVTTAYRESLTALPPLNLQGDGMRSLLGLLLPVVAATYPIILIDEPEAFLHPPQAYELGRTLAKLAMERGVQLVLATHDRNLLAGLLAAEVEVTVVRLDREGNDTSAHQLSSADLKTLWTNPVMRYSNVLDGLFHRVVVVAEADQDCRFYAAAIDEYNNNHTLPISPSEIHFVPSAGKDGMSKLVAALRAVSVRVVACPDLDLLDDEAKVKKLVISFGGDWADFKKNYDLAVQNLKSAKVDATIADVLSALGKEFAGNEGDPWTEETKKSIKAHTRTSQTEFKKLKRYGVATFSGQAATHADLLLKQLDAIGICCVREGELERLAPNLGVAKSPAWLGAALEAGTHKDELAQKHVERVIQAANLGGDTDQ